MVEVPTILSETGNRGPATPDPSLMMNLMNQSINESLNRMPENEDNESDDTLMKSSSSMENIRRNSSEG